MKTNSLNNVTKYNKKNAVSSNKSVLTSNNLKSGKKVQSIALHEIMYFSATLLSIRLSFLRNKSRFKNKMLKLLSAAELILLAQDCLKMRKKELCVQN